MCVCNAVTSLMTSLFLCLERPIPALCQDMIWSNCLPITVFQSCCSPCVSTPPIRTQYRAPILADIYRAGMLTPEIIVILDPV